VVVAPPGSAACAAVAQAIAAGSTTASTRASDRPFRPCRDHPRQGLRACSREVPEFGFSPDTAAALLPVRTTRPRRSLSFATNGASAAATRAYSPLPGCTRSPHGRQAVSPTTRQAPLPGTVDTTAAG
jgi:hypothetical protein